MRKSKKEELKNESVFEEGSGNVFVDLGFPEHESVNLAARAKLMMQIEDIIKERGWTQKEAAKILGIGQSRVSELMTTRVDKFTIDMLMKFLDRLGRRVDFTVRPEFSI